MNIVPDRWPDEAATQPTEHVSAADNVATHVSILRRAAHELASEADRFERESGAMLAAAPIDPDHTQPSISASSASLESAALTKLEALAVGIARALDESA